MTARAGIIGSIILAIIFYAVELWDADGVYLLEKKMIVTQ